MRQTDLPKAGEGRSLPNLGGWGAALGNTAGGSGGIQLAGREDSKIIVAITKDGEAPLFQVGGLFRAVPALIAKLDAPN